jgi:hypothetical protein
MAAPMAVIPLAPKAVPRTNDKPIDMTIFSHLSLCALRRQAGILAANIISTMKEEKARVIIIMNMFFILYI